MSIRNGQAAGLQPAIEMRGVTVRFDGRAVLNDVDWTVPAGSLAGLVGPNGGGKSTLLRTVVGRIRPESGEVRIFGADGRRPRAGLSYLPQNEEIDWAFPVRVIDVVLQGPLGRLPWWRRPGPEARRAAEEALERVRLSDQAERPIGDLSGGQRQRALLARALAADARLILLDEPATGLDATAQHDLLDILTELRDEGRTVVVTTHDLNCLVDRFDTVLCLKNRVVCEGAPNETLTPDHLYDVFGRHIPVLTSQGEVTLIDHD